MNTIKVKNKQGKELEVTKKAFEVVYKPLGFTISEAKRRTSKVIKDE